MRRGGLEALRQRHPLAFWSTGWALFLGALGVLVGLALLVDREATLAFLWTDVVGPWLAENRGRSALTWNGHTATTGYTPALEAFYVVLIVFALANAWYALARPIGLTFDRRLTYAITPPALGATLGRVLEDGLFFCRPGTIEGLGCHNGPLTFLATSPGNFTATYLLVCLLIGVLAWRSGASRRDQRTQFRVLLVVQALVALLVLGPGARWLAFALPWTVALFALADPIYGVAREADLDHVPAGLLASGLVWLAIPAVHLAAWIRAPLIPGGGSLAYGAWVLASTVAALVALWGLARALTPAFPRAAGLEDAWGLAIVGGHALDGFATFFSVCAAPGGICSGAAFAGLELAAYAEKHPLSEALLSLADGWAFPILKLALAAGVVMLAAPYFGDPDEESKVGFLLLIVWYAGLLPGVRDVGRVLIGI